MSGSELVLSDLARPLWPILEDRLGKARRLDVSSAFFADAAAVSKLLESGVQRVRIVVSARYPTNPSDLRALRKDTRVSIRVACAEQAGSFHEKAYLARDADDRPLLAYVGSANWTHRGMNQNREAGVLLDEAKVLEELARHFELTHAAAEPLSEAHLDALEQEHVRQRNAGSPGALDRGVMRRRWSSVRKYMIKQNGISSNPFREGSQSYWERIGGRLVAGQTQSRIFDTFAEGQGVIVVHIARRRDNRPDRLVYGRGLIQELDTDRWRLPKQYVEWLVQAGYGAQLELIQQWPEVFWLEPAEFINYGGDSSEWVWVGDVLGDDSGKTGFQGGYRWLTEEEWVLLNEALDRASDRFGIGPVEMDGVWWNSHLGTPRGDPMYMTRQLMEAMNLPEGGSR